MAKSILPKVTPELIGLVLLVVVYLNRELVMSKVNELVALATGKKEEEFSVMGQNKYLDMAIQVSLVVLVLLNLNEIHRFFINVGVISVKEQIMLLIYPLFFSIQIGLEGFLCSAN